MGPAGTITPTTMTEAGTAADALPLLAWLSPGYPVGAYAYSHGLEWAVEAGKVRDEATLAAWLADVLAHGAGRNDAILLAQAYRAALSLDLSHPEPHPEVPRSGLEGGLRSPPRSPEPSFEAALRFAPQDEGAEWDGAGGGLPRAMSALAALNDLALALAPSRELHLETSQQGRSFLDATLGAWPAPRLAALAPALPGPVAYPVAVGLAAAAHGLPLATVLPAYGLAFVQNLVSAGIRLAPVGQAAGTRIVAGLMPGVRRLAREAASLTLDDLGSATLRADLGSYLHETQYTRLFRS